MKPAAFACPPDCGWCCTHLERERGEDEALFEDALREEGVYSCGHPARGLSLDAKEAARFRSIAKERDLRVKLHPRTFLLDSGRRQAVILDWHWDHVACPFYADYKCTVYEARPLVCRAFPVMLASPLSFAPECPKAPAPRASVTSELRARRSIDKAHAVLDERAHQAMARGRFARGLMGSAARERLQRYRALDLDTYLACTAPARS